MCYKHVVTSSVYFQCLHYLLPFYTQGCGSVPASQRYCCYIYKVLFLLANSLKCPCEGLLLESNGTREANKSKSLSTKSGLNPMCTTGARGPTLLITSSGWAESKCGPLVCSEINDCPSPLCGPNPVVGSADSGLHINHSIRATNRGFPAAAVCCWE